MSILAERYSEDALGLMNEGERIASKGLLVWQMAAYMASAIVSALLSISYAIQEK